MKDNLIDKKLNHQNIHLLNVFLYIFLILCIFLTMTLYFFYKINSGNSDELFLLRDIHKLKAYFKDCNFIKLNSLENNNNSPKVFNQSNKFIK
jgi:hypothetical protein